MTAIISTYNLTSASYQHPTAKTEYASSNSRITRPPPNPAKFKEMQMLNNLQEKLNDELNELEAQHEDLKSKAMSLSLIMNKVSNEGQRMVRDKLRLRELLKLKLHELESKSDCLHHHEMIHFEKVNNFWRQIEM